MEAVPWFEFTDGRREPLDWQGRLRPESEIAAATLTTSPEEAEAARLLDLHGYPVDHLERPIVWAWIGDELRWAEAPSREGFVVGLARPWRPPPQFWEHRPVPDRVPRAGSWRAAKKAPGFAAAWPPFGALDWALHVYEGRRAQRYAREELDQGREPSKSLLALMEHASVRLASFLVDKRTAPAVKEARELRERGLRGAATQRAKAKAWHGQVLDLAKTLRAKHPKWPRTDIAQMILAAADRGELSDFPMRRADSGQRIPDLRETTLVKQLKTWERAGHLDPPKA